MSGNSEFLCQLTGEPLWAVFSSCSTLRFVLCGCPNELTLHSVGTRSNRTLLLIKIKLLVRTNFDREDNENCKVNWGVVVPAGMVLFSKPVKLNCYICIRSEFSSSS
jgi:hypothetical protein